MDAPPASMRALAQQLLALEAASQSEINPHSEAGVRVCEKLRISLTRFAGAQGFTALLRRALALAQADAPLLQTLKLDGDGCLLGLEELGSEEVIAGVDAATQVIAHLLGLLATFIGVPLTLGLVREAWPELDMNK
jgi:hypothetical protein